MSDCGHPNHGSADHDCGPFTREQPPLLLWKWDATCWHCQSTVTVEQTYDQESRPPTTPQEAAACPVCEYDLPGWIHWNEVKS